MNRNEKGEDLNQTSQNIKDNFVTRFESMKESNSEIFINKIEKIDCIYNKTKNIYFDNEKVHLEIK